MIETIFTELDPYLRGIKKADNYSVIEAHLKSSWLIPEHGSIQNQNKKIDGGLVYYMFYSETDSFDKLINWLKDDVVSMNIEVEQKEELLKQKVSQLKEMFETSSLDELKNLKFSSDDDVLKLSGKGNNNTKKEEPVKDDKKSKDDKKTVEA